MFQKRSSIRYKLILTMLIITVVPLMIAGYLQYRNAVDAVYGLTISDLQYMTHNKAAELAAYTETADPSKEDRRKIEEITREVAEHYYQPNGMKGYAFIIDQTGTALFHPKQDVIGDNLGTEPYIQQMLQQKQGWIEYEFQGEPKLTAFQTLPNGWVIGMEATRTTCFSRSTRPA